METAVPLCPTPPINLSSERPPDSSSEARLDPHSQPLRLGCIVPDVPPGLPESEDCTGHQPHLSSPAWSPGIAWRAPSPICLPHLDPRNHFPASPPHPEHLFSAPVCWTCPSSGTYNRRRHYSSVGGGGVRAHQQLPKCQNDTVITASSEMSTCRDPACPRIPGPWSPQVDPLTQSVKKGNGQGDHSIPGLELI